MSKDGAEIVKEVTKNISEMFSKINDADLIMKIATLEVLVKKLKESRTNQEKMLIDMGVIMIEPHIHHMEIIKRKDE